MLSCFARVSVCVCWFALDLSDSSGANDNVVSDDAMSSGLDTAEGNDDEDDDEDGE